MGDSIKKFEEMKVTQRPNTSSSWQTFNKTEKKNEIPPLEQVNENFKKKKN